MRRRGLIRGLFLLPLLLCVGGWAWSVTHGSTITYCQGDHFGGCESSWGLITVYLGRGTGMPRGWVCQDNPAPAPNFWPRDTPDSHAFIGFGLGRMLYEPGTVYWLSMPYWFLIVVFSAVLFFVWRKTRPKINPQMAFPVELGRPHG